MSHGSKAGWQRGWGDCHRSGGGRQLAQRDCAEAKPVQRALRHNALEGERYLHNSDKEWFVKLYQTEIVLENNTRHYLKKKEKENSSWGIESSYIHNSFFLPRD
jgi:hypothetical protein